MGAYKRQCYTGEDAQRILAGEHRIKVWREKRGLSQAAAAAAAGMSPAYLSEIEVRKKPGSVAALAALARVLEVKVDDLTGPPPPRRDRNRMPD